jgi:hypothetical protein
MDKLYGVWIHDTDPAYAWLRNGMPPLLEDVSVALQSGDPVGASFPTDVVFDLSPDHGMQLTDSLGNTLLLHVVSERLKAAIEKTKVPVEFHRVQVRNQKKRIAREPYYIMNVLGTIDCMDRQKSDFDESSLVPGEASVIRRLELDLSKIPDQTPIFRLSADQNVVLVRLDLAREIFRKIECQGMIFMKMELFGEEFRDPDPDEDEESD